jgi:hypothetical protein|tara:strand:- start:23 stop:244 length:222 start_codon:yes stop_codon:yes gene_type:complete
MEFTKKDMIWLIGIVASLAMTWGMWTQRLEAVEQKADAVAKMQQDIAVIKEKIIWMEEYMIKTYDDSRNPLQW